MRQAAWILVAATFFIGCTTFQPANAQHTEATGAVATRAGGDRSFSFDSAMRIPAGNPAGVMIGPIHVLDDGTPLEEVGVALNIQHASPGHLTISLDYDADNDGVIDVSVPVELYRVRLGGFNSPEIHAYPDPLEGRYFFQDDIGANGHALPDPLADPGTPSFSSFDGLKKGGSFYLAITDDDPADAGCVLGWSVHMSDALSVAAR